MFSTLFCPCIDLWVRSMRDVWMTWNMDTDVPFHLLCTYESDPQRDRPVDFRLTGRWSPEICTSDWSHEVAAGRCWTCLLRDGVFRDPRRHDTVSPVQLPHRSLFNESGFTSICYERTHSHSVDPELKVQTQTQVWMVEEMDKFSVSSFCQIYSSIDVVPPLITVRRQWTTFPGINLKTFSSDLYSQNTEHIRPVSLLIL